MLAPGLVAQSLLLMSLGLMCVGPEGLETSPLGKAGSPPPNLSKACPAAPRLGSPKLLQSPSMVLMFFVFEHVSPKLASKFSNYKELSQDFKEGLTSSCPIELTAMRATSMGPFNSPPQPKAMVVVESLAGVN